MNVKKYSVYQSAFSVDGVHGQSLLMKYKNPDYVWLWVSRPYISSKPNLKDVSVVHNAFRSSIDP